jgi:hypothetical protein
LVPSGVAWTAGSGEWKWLHGRARAAQVKNKGLTGGVLLTVREEREDDQLGRRKPKRETHFHRGAISTRARWVGKGGCCLRGRLG